MSAVDFSHYIFVRVKTLLRLSIFIFLVLSRKALHIYFSDIFTYYVMVERLRQQFTWKTLCILSFSFNNKKREQLTNKQTKAHIPGYVQYVQVSRMNQSGAFTKWDRAILAGSNLIFGYRKEQLEREREINVMVMTSPMMTSLLLM